MECIHSTHPTTYYALVLRLSFPLPCTIPPFLSEIFLSLPLICFSTKPVRLFSLPFLNTNKALHILLVSTWGYTHNTFSLPDQTKFMPLSDGLEQGNRVSAFVALAREEKPSARYSWWIQQLHTARQMCLEIDRFVSCQPAFESLDALHAVQPQLLHRETLQRWSWFSISSDPEPSWQQEPFAGHNNLWTALCSSCSLDACHTAFLPDFANLVFCRFIMFLEIARPLPGDLEVHPA